MRSGRTEDEVFEQPLNLSRFRPPGESPRGNGPLRVCFVGSLDLRKGFIYLLRAIKLLGPKRVSLEIVGATGDRLCKQLFARERCRHQFALRRPVTRYRPIIAPN